MRIKQFLLSALAVSILAAVAWPFTQIASLVIRAVDYVLPDFSPDARESLRLDREFRDVWALEAHRSKWPTTMFRKRAMTHDRFTAGGFAIDDVLSPA